MGTVGVGQMSNILVAIKPAYYFFISSLLFTQNNRIFLEVIYHCWLRNTIRNIKYIRMLQGVNVCFFLYLIHRNSFGPKYRGPELLRISHPTHTKGTEIRACYPINELN
jgi:hypothetical protein